ICSKNIELENGFLSETHYIYSLNKTTQYRCKPGYVTSTGKMSGSITCLQNGWSPQPSCIKSCDRPVFENAGTENNSTLFKLNDELDYECHIGYVNKHNRTRDSIICNDDGWSDVPSCYDSTKTCGPPPPIDNGDITSFPLPVYAPLSSVEYQCQSLYQLQGNKKITCRDGEWSEKPKCLDPCIVSEEIMKKHNIIFRRKEKQKRYYKSGEMQEFKCKSGYHRATSQRLQTFCIEGHINYPTCTKSQGDAGPNKGEVLTCSAFQNQLQRQVMVHNGLLPPPAGQQWSDSQGFRERRSDDDITPRTAGCLKTAEKTILQEDTGQPPHSFLLWFYILKCNHSAWTLEFCTILSHQRHNHFLGEQHEAQTLYRSCNNTEVWDQNPDFGMESTLSHRLSSAGAWFRRRGTLRLQPRITSKMVEAAPLSAMLSQQSGDN
ncbi:hypothetical protein U0070_009504, partial [Myodes glareolus]